jgi:hypothetical protein
VHPQPLTFACPFPTLCWEQHRGIPLIVGPTKPGTNAPSHTTAASTALDRQAAGNSTVGRIYLQSCPERCMIIRVLPAAVSLRALTSSNPIGGHVILHISKRRTSTKDLRPRNNLSALDYEYCCATTIAICGRNSPNLLTYDMHNSRCHIC